MKRPALGGMKPVFPAAPYYPTWAGPHPNRLEQLWQRLHLSEFPLRIVAASLAAGSPLFSALVASRLLIELAQI